MHDTASSGDLVLCTDSAYFVPGPRLDRGECQAKVDLPMFDMESVCVCFA